MNQADIHATLLEILQAVLALCEAEKIAYFLIGGGCLGIARHDHGFVPWNDDLNIAVWAGDMPRFLAAAQQLPAPPDQPSGVFIDVGLASGEIIARNKNRQPFYNYDIRREMLPVF